MKCAVRGKDTSQKIVKFTPGAIEKCLLVLEYRRSKPVNKKFRTKYDFLELLDETFLNQGYHAQCYRLVTSIEVPADFQVKKEMKYEASESPESYNIPESTTTTQGTGSPTDKVEEDFESNIQIDEISIENTQIKMESIEEDLKNFELHAYNQASNLPLTEEVSNFKQDSENSDDMLHLSVYSKPTCDEEKMSSEYSEEHGKFNITHYSCNTTPNGLLKPTGSPPRLVTVPTTGENGSERTVSQSLSSSRGRKTLKVQRLQSARRSLSIFDDTFADSGSDGESDDIASDEDEVALDIYLRKKCRRLRQEIIEKEEVECEEKVSEMMLDSVNMNVLKSSVHSNSVLNVSTEFDWTDDSSTFTGQRENYRRDPGPTFTSSDPVDIFLKFWDDEVMELIASETNIYARQIIEPYSDPDIGGAIPKYLETWDDVTVPMLYQYFAVLICMSSCQRSKVKEYWETGLMEMPRFRQIMSRDTFLLITKFLHFVSDSDIMARGYDRKIAKVAPILDQCNRKFSELYIPSQHISLDESLLLWKGKLSWRQCSRSKVPRFGIKSFELCEATTGYLLKCKLYTGKDTPMHPEPFHGFSNKTAKVVLELMEGYLDVGHVLVMDNWYNQLLLTRYLKSRGTDVVGKISRTRKEVPQDLKDLVPSRVERGEWHARHCGDISLVAWKDVKLVTLMSTYHDHEIVPGRRDTKTAREKPVSVKEYNQFMGGVDLKDQKLSKFLFERKRCQKWYMKVFRRLLSTSLLNAFIIYTKHPMHRLSHRDFRRNVSEGLLARFGKVITPLPASLTNKELRLQPGNHIPVYTEKMPNKGEHKRMSCERCRLLKKRSQVRLMCSLCQVALCVGKCWLDYHTRENLFNTPRKSQRYDKDGDR